jgi:hypothetical protein
VKPLVIESPKGIIPIVELAGETEIINEKNTKNTIARPTLVFISTSALIS